MRRQQPEAQSQAELFRWASLVSLRLPELRLLFAVPNGGHRHRAVAARLKDEGVKAGVPDVALMVPRGQYHGLWLELKAGKNRPTPQQKWWLDELARQGYRTEVCHGFDQAKAAIESYLALPPAPEPTQEAA